MPESTDSFETNSRIYKSILNKMKLLKWLVLMLILQNACVVSAQDFCSFIKQVQDYQDSAKLVRLENQPPMVDTLTFNWKSYQNYFNELIFSEGVEFHLYNNYDQSGGSPLLYGLNNEFNGSIYTKEKLEKAISKIDSGEIKTKYKKQYLEYLSNQLKINPENYYAREPENNLMNFVQPGNSKMGYLQFLFLSEFGESFALFWHAFYGQKKILCSKNDIDFYLNFYSKQNDMFEIERAKLERLSTENLQPKVKFQHKKCKITWYEIWTHRGIYRKTYSIQKEPSFTVILENEQKVVDINAMFFY